MTDDTSARLKVAMERRKIESGSALARASKIPESTIRSYLGGSRNPPVETLEHLAEVLRVSPKWLRDNQGPMEGEPQLVDRRHPGDHYRAPPLIVGERADMPVYASAEGGEGALIISHDTVDHVRRPYTLEGIQEAYGIVIEGQSMEPAYEAGDTAWVNPRLGARRGHDAIFYAETPDDPLRRALIKRVIGISDDHWTVRQYNPPSDFKLERATWSVCHRVVGKLNKR